MQGVLDLSSEAAALTKGAEAAVEEQRRAVAALEAAAAEIDGVTGLLREMPKRLAHRVMVPFGEAAFFPGRLVRTNECMVQLGEGHMVESTAHQAAGILARRKARLQAQLAATARELRAAEGRLAEASGQLQADTREGVREILEEYDPAVHGPLAAERPAGAFASSHAPTTAMAAGRQAAGGEAAEAGLFRRMAALEAEEAAAEAGAAAGAAAPATAAPAAGAVAGPPGGSSAGKGPSQPLARGFFDRPKPPPKPASVAPASHVPQASSRQVLQGVVERQQAAPQQQQQPAQPPAAAQARGEPPKKVSRFKQQRLAGSG